VPVTVPEAKVKLAVERRSRLPAVLGWAYQPGFVRSQPYQQECAKAEKAAGKEAHHVNRHSIHGIIGKVDVIGVSLANEKSGFA